MVRQVLIILAVVVAFGILVPIYKGLGFLDARIIAAYSLLAPLFVAPASSEISNDAPRSAIVTRIAIITAWGWGITILILATAVVTLNLMSRRPGFILPPASFLTSILVFSLAAAVAISMLGATLATRFQASQVKTILRSGFLIILLALLFGSRVLPENLTTELFFRFSSRRALTRLAWQASAVAGAFAVILLLTLLKTRPAGPFAKIPMAENPDQGGR
jgi:hypothetical protein